MAMPLGFALLATEASTGFATSADHFVASAMAFALPWLKALSVLIIIWGVLCAAVRLVGMEIKLLQGKDLFRPIRGLKSLRNPHPRLAPWAILFRPWRGWGDAGVGKCLIRNDE